MSQKHKYKSYTKEFKQEAVALVTEQGYSAVEAAESVGVNPNQIYAWKKHFEEQASGAALSNDERAELLERHNQVGSLNSLMTEFYESADFAALSQVTQKDYFKYGRKVALVFGTVDPDAIQPKHIRKYMDMRGAKAPTQANREKTFLSRVYRWAYERGKVKMNPCAGVRAFKEAPRDRYIEDWEYKAVYDRAPLHVQIAMEISYLCAARKTDVLTMAWEQVREEGIFIQQGKTGFKQIKAWTPRLKAALDKAKTLPKDRVVTRWVICQSNGSKYTNRGFDQGWMSAREQAREELNAAMDFTFHDLKAKAISDYEGSSKDKQVFSGHKTENQVATYDRKVKVTPTLGSKKGLSYEKEL